MSEVSKLGEKWRALAKDAKRFAVTEYESGRADELASCADELAASLAAHGRVEVTALLQAVESLQEYRPSAQKHPHVKSGMLGYMTPKSKTLEGEEYGWVKLGDVLSALTTTLEKTP